MVMQPKVLLLDEPTSIDDPVCTGEFFSILNKITRSRSHDYFMRTSTGKYFFYGDKVCLYGNGKVMASTRPEVVAKKFNCG
jgi:energy-coupling factor transporter ATP-binding protein EcfA2